MRPAILLLVLLATLGAIPSVGYAAAPPYIPVQGVLEDINDTPVNGSVDMVFSVYAQPSGGTALWTETQTVQVDQGHFTAYLGQSIPLELSLFRDYHELYLGIQVGSDQEMARIFLGSQPFSAYAEYTGGMTLSGLSCSSGQVAKWYGTAWVCADDEEGESGTDTLAELNCGAGQVVKWAGTAWVCADDDDTDTDTDTVAALNCGAGQIVKWAGTAWVCADDEEGDPDTDTLAGLSCANGQVAKWNGSAWTCADDIDTDTDTLGDMTCADGQLVAWDASGSQWVCENGFERCTVWKFDNRSGAAWKYFRFNMPYDCKTAWMDNGQSWGCHWQISGEHHSGNDPNNVWEIPRGADFIINGPGSDGSNHWYIKNFDASSAWHYDLGNSSPDMIMWYHWYDVCRIYDSYYDGAWHEGHKNSPGPGWSDWGAMANVYTICYLRICEKRPVPQGATGQVWETY